jgi:hypothetical protein
MPSRDLLRLRDKLSLLFWRWTGPGVLVARKPLEAVEDREGLRGGARGGPGFYATSSPGSTPTRPPPLSEQGRCMKWAGQIIWRCRPVILMTLDHGYQPQRRSCAEDGAHNPPRQPICVVRVNPGRVHSLGKCNYYRLQFYYLNENCSEI